VRANPRSALECCPTRGWSGRIRTVHASIVHLCGPTTLAVAWLSAVSLRARRRAESVRSAWRASQGLWRRNPRNIGETGPCTSPGHAQYGTPHRAGRPRCRRTLRRVGNAVGADRQGPGVSWCCVGDTAYRYSSAGGRDPREGERAAPLLPLNRFLAEQASSTPPHHPHAHHTFMLSTQPPSVEGTRSRCSTASHDARWLQPARTTSTPCLTACRGHYNNASILV
jgi:hypothetical protein